MLHNLDQRILDRLDREWHAARLALHAAAGRAQLTAETGQALVVLAERISPYRRQLLDEFIALLEPISQVGARPLYPRSALLHATFLAKAYLLKGEHARAVNAAGAAMTRLEEVQSLRGIDWLRKLRTMFARRRSRTVTAFLPELDEALSMM